MDDGFSTIIELLTTGVTLYEKTVTPPGVDGGGEVDTTTMRNTTWRTRWPKKLKTLSEASVTAAYDPADFDTLNDAINVNQQIKVTFPDDGGTRVTVTFWGWLNTFTPGENTEGEQPTAEFSFIPSNQDNDKTEQGPIVGTA